MGDWIHFGHCPIVYCPSARPLTKCLQFCYIQIMPKTIEELEKLNADLSDRINKLTEDMEAQKKSSAAHPQEIAALKETIATLQAQLKTTQDEIAILKKRPTSDSGSSAGFFEDALHG